MRFFRRRSAQTLNHAPISEAEVSVVDAVQASGFFKSKPYLLRHREIRSFRERPPRHFHQYRIVLGSEHIEEPGPWLLNVLAAEDVHECRDCELSRLGEEVQICTRIQVRTRIAMLVDAVLAEMNERPLPEGTNFSVAQQIGF